ncbi:MAG: radical SAM protein [Clostridia bacterium]|nr:radical SAM protein [Clostridia bacterium]
MKSHRNLPFFVPHAGCKNCCVFCSQTKITGQSSEKDPSTEIAELRAMCESAEGDFSESQIAFFGGSFTAIERSRMESLLAVANEYIDKGIADGIRISTRPDCIDEEILKLLKKYRVTHIELGVQSTSDEVLAASKRGHTADDSFKAAELINNYGFVFGGQMMVGLPGSDTENEQKTALDIVKMGARESRIYPTVVFEETELYDMAQAGAYLPLDMQSAIERTARCYRIFHEAGVNVLRVGLHASENLKNAPLGANHQSLGELVKGCVYGDIIAERAGDCKGKIISVGINRNDISMLCGHNRSAIKRIIELTGCADVELYPSETARFEPYIKTRSV